MSTTLFVLDVEDFRPLAEVAAKDPANTVRRLGPYYLVSSDGPITIARDDTGCRNAVWYSSVAAIRHGRVSRWDRHVLRVEPTTAPVTPFGGDHVQ
ncbi:hypothetical protein ACIP88_13330 [Streptomyces uncialis]|uniref:hypothetical protein n=1 Tax=Streptomyces uncialis TaxID=1048205 RepID=UPI0038248EF7